ncbi:molybdate ABC transporter substrate-binding protein [Micromonospora sp. CPCC 205556]|uniref:molybdate ABC transporter substrate-binding protein n=1 Tax=Micromonospora sp. CPCC 205556 TaxID=3122398 RepID=UPI002FF2BD70
MTARCIRSALAALAALTVVGATACGSGAGDRRPAGGGSAGAVTGTVTVFAAASLTESFTALGTAFEAAHPGAEVNFNFAGSSALAAQINQGAPADVFASAAPKNMATVTEAGNGADSPTTFARNQLVIAVPKGNARKITGLADLAGPGIKVALCAEQVPCGAAGTRALAAAKVTLTPVTLEQDVRGALSKVKLGEVDAALVYRTDARTAADAVDSIEFPESASAINDYPIIVLRDAPNQAGARAFVAYVLSAAGRTALTDAGFQAPAGS